VTRRSIALAVVLTVIALAIVIVIPTRRSEVAAGAGLIAFLGAYVVLAESVGRGVAYGSVVDAVLRRPEPRPTRPSDLEKLERSIGWKAYDGAEFDARVRPLLADLVRHRGGTESDVEAILTHTARVTTGDIERIVDHIEALRPGTT
jgi:hypothetical protein